MFGYDVRFLKTIFSSCVFLEQITLIKVQIANNPYFKLELAPPIEIHSATSSPIIF